MYKILIALFIIFVALLIFCKDFEHALDPNKKYVKLKYYSNSSCEASFREYETVVLDSCEYVYVTAGPASWGSHKGNCKFCAERSKK